MPVRLVLLLVATFAGCAAFVVWAQRHQIAATRREAWEERQADKRLLAQLDNVIVADRRELTLADLPAYLEAQTGLPVEFEEQRLLEYSIDPTAETFTLPEGQVTARAILSHVLPQYDLGYDASRGRLRITTRERLQEAMHLAIYPAPQPGLTAASSEDEWLDLVTSTIQPNMWDEVGGPGHIEALPGGLAVVQTREVQDEVSALFTRLGDMENPPRSWEPVPLYPPAPNAAEQRIEKILQEIISIDVQDQPLNMLVSDLSYKYKLPIVLVQRKLAEAGVSVTTPITIKVSNVPLRSALRAVLDNLELTYVTRYEMVRITTPEDAESQLVTIAYPVHDLVAYPEGIDFDSLTELTSTIIAPYSWGEGSGPGPLSAISTGWVIFSQTDEVHAQVAELLTALRRTLSEGGSPPMPLGTSPAHSQIEAALEREISFDYPRTELRDICTDLSNQLGINVRLNAKKLEEAGVNIDTPIICSFPKASLRVQLLRLCDALELTFCIRYDLLLLTTPEDAESYLTTCIYDVRPLLDPDLGLTDSDSLIELVTRHVPPDTWDEVGGPGAIQEFRGLLVVSHTQEIHRQVASLLQQLETHCLPRVQAAEVPPLVLVPESPREQRIERALQEPIEVSLCGVPLDEALSELAARANVPITIDLASLPDDLSERTLISLSGHSLPLAQVLEAILRPLDLEYGVAHEQILVTGAQSNVVLLPLRLYAVADSLANGSPDLDAFSGRLEAEIDPQSWESQGGPNTLTLLNERWLAVMATTSIHSQLANWLKRERANGLPDDFRSLGTPLKLDARLRLPTQVAAGPTIEQIAQVDVVKTYLLTGACELALGWSPPDNPRALREVLPPEPDPFAPLDGADPFAAPTEGATP